MRSLAKVVIALGLSAISLLNIGAANAASPEEEFIQAGEPMKKIGPVLANLYEEYQRAPTRRRSNHAVAS